MSEDYYKILGIKRGASDDEIQRAYREQARKYHPDLNPDDAKAKEKFQSVQRAYEVLNDPEQREMYDRFGSSFDKMGGAPGGGRPGGGAGGFPGGNIDLEEFLRDRFGGASGGAAGGTGGFADLFRQFSGGVGAGQAQSRQRVVNGRSLQHQLEVPFQTSIVGGDARITVQRQSGKSESIDVRVPAGIEDGKKIRLRGQGEPSPNGGNPGDILITVKVAPHPWFQRRGKNLELRVPITLKEAVAGASIDVPTPKGEISLKIPPSTSSGKKLRIKGFGVSTKEGDGDLYAEIQIVLPDELPSDVAAAIDRLEIGPDEPRSGLCW
jgi:DnaJ-class molecular chaperone